MSNYKKLRPTISVIITVYDRKEFVIEAVESVIKQTAKREDYEIIVVKNYLDDKIDRFLLENEIESIISKDQVVLFTKEALTKARGEIISFLEDDDRFLPRKLDEVMRIFNDNRRIAYLHNNFYEVSRNGEIRKKSLIRPASRDHILDTAKLNQRKRAPLLRYYAFYNASSISVRKDVLLRIMEEHPDLIRGSPDICLLLLFSFSGCQIMFSSQYLTELRVHSDSWTFTASDPDQLRLDLLGKEEKIYQSLVNKYKGSFAYPLLRIQNLELVFRKYLLDSSVNRPKIDDLLEFSYYSFKRGNRLYLLIVLLRYVGLVSQRRLNEIAAFRKKGRISN